MLLLAELDVFELAYDDLASYVGFLVQSRKVLDGVLNFVLQVLPHPSLLLQLFRRVLQFYHQVLFPLAWKNVHLPFDSLQSLKYPTSDFHVFLL